MKFFFYFLLGSFSLTSLAQTSYVPVTKLLKEKGSQIFLSGDIFNTSKTIDKDGDRRSLSGGERFRRTQFEAGGFYGAANNFQLGLGARYRQHHSTYTFNNEEIRGTSAGLQSVFASLIYGFEPEGKNQYTMEGLYRYVPYTNGEVNSVNDQEDLILGDDGHEYSVGLAFTHSFESNNYFTARGGWRNPGSNLSTELYWQAEGALAWRYIALVAGVDGVSSLKNDEDTVPNYSTGNSALYNSVNREWIAPYVGLNIALGNLWRVELRGTQVISGRSTDMGTGFGFQLIRRSDKSTQKFIDSRFKAYDVEATVTKISPKKGYVVIDKGLTQDIEKGIKFDFFEFDYVGGNILVARGIVIQSKSETSIVKITHHYNLKKEIKEGLVARASLK